VKIVLSQMAFYGAAMHILFIGDIVGRPGRESVATWLPRLRDEGPIDFVVANAENSAGGIGATPKVLKELRASGIDAFTMGNHVWRKRELMPALDAFPELIRPANYPKGTAGQGAAALSLPTGQKIGIVNVLGRVFMEPLECPFAAAEREIASLRGETSFILVDIHAEATSEKVAMGWHLDGECTAVLGTHTHVQTADERILPKGTAYISDVGMCGPLDSVLGVECETVLRRFKTGLPERFNVASGPAVFNAVLIKADESTGQALEIARIVRHGAPNGTKCQ
jgi:2',3'-cyclic-nucleotide 2'-phosphodiesterase